jgi:hypothetical protein
MNKPSFIGAAAHSALASVLALITVPACRAGLSGHRRATLLCTEAVPQSRSEPREASFVDGRQVFSDAGGWNLIGDNQFLLGDVTIDQMYVQFSGSMLEAAT